MSRAFVKEPDGDEVADDLPERKISPHPNYVTPRGQQLLQEQLQHAEAEQQRLQGKEEMSAKQVLAREIPLNELTGDENGPRISDDRPFNEYFVLRRLSAGSLANSEGQEP